LEDSIKKSNNKQKQKSMKISAVLSEFRLYLCNEWINRIPSHTLRNSYYKYFMGFQIGKQSAILMHTEFDCARGLILGDNSVINSRCRIDTRGGVTIGRGVSISADVIILTADHEKNEHGDYNRELPVVIENFVWIGTRAMILPGVRIGKGAKIAAGAIVTKDVPPLTLYGGIPAKFIRNVEEQHCESTFARNYQRLFQ
jgi:acetyltransferase-like isoleucine patch superfamily enzyme